MTNEELDEKELIKISIEELFLVMKVIAEELKNVHGVNLTRDIFMSLENAIAESLSRKKANYLFVNLKLPDESSLIFETFEFQAKWFIIDYYVGKQSVDEILDFSKYTDKVQELTETLISDKELSEAISVNISAEYIIEKIGKRLHVNK